jgi:DNA-binding MarR family transcriptional regulator
MVNYIIIDIGGFMGDLRDLSGFLSFIYRHKLSPADMHVLNHLIMKYAEFEQRKAFVLNQTALAKDLAMKQPNVSRAVKNLVGTGILVKQDTAYFIDLA